MPQAGRGNDVKEAAGNSVKAKVLQGGVTIHTDVQPCAARTFSALQKRLWV